MSTKVLLRPTSLFLGGGGFSDGRSGVGISQHERRICTNGWVWNCSFKQLDDFAWTRGGGESLGSGWGVGDCHRSFITSSFSCHIHGSCTTGNETLRMQCMVILGMALINPTITTLELFTFTPEIKVHLLFTAILVGIMEMRWMLYGYSWDMKFYVH